MRDKPTDWHIRPYAPGDEQALVVLFRRVFGRSMSEAHWLWKFRGQPGQVENVWLAVGGGRILGQYAAIPTRFWLDGRERPIMVGADAMVDPDARRRGLWTALVVHAHAAWGVAGVPFALGLPNERWGSRREALGWRSLGGLGWLVRPLRPARLALRRLGVPGAAAIPRALAVPWNAAWNRALGSTGGVELARVTAADESFDALWLAARDGLGRAAVRDRAWVQWRFLNAPARDYHVLLARRGGQPIGYAVCWWREGPRGRLVTVADLLAPPGDGATRRALWRAVVDYALARDGDAVAALAVPGSGLATLLRRAGFRPRWGTFDVRAAALAELEPARLDDPTRWYLTGSEFDAV